MYANPTELLVFSIYHKNDHKNKTELFTYKTSKALMFSDFKVPV